MRFHLLLLRQSPLPPSLHLPPLLHLLPPSQPLLLLPSQLLLLLPLRLRIRSP